MAKQSSTLDSVLLQEQKLQIEKTLALEKAFKSNDANEIMKAQQYLKTIEKRQDIDFKSIIVDPLDMTTALGYKQKPYNLSFDVLRAMGRAPIVKAIVETRKEQVMSFCEPQSNKYATGFVIVKKRGYRQQQDQEVKLTKAEEAKIDELYDFIMNCGADGNYWSQDSFDVWVNKIMGDSLVLDQACVLPGAKVELADGQLINIEEIESDMIVRTHTGQIKKIIKPTSRLYSGNLYEIKVNAEKIFATEGHPILVANRTSIKGNKVTIDDENLKWIPASELDPEVHFVAYPRLKNIEEEIYIYPFKDQPRKYFQQGCAQDIADAVGCCRKTVELVYGGHSRASQDLKSRIFNKGEELGIIYDIQQLVEEETLLTEEWAKFLGFYTAEGGISGNAINITFNDDEVEYKDFILKFASDRKIATNIVTYKDHCGVTIWLNDKRLLNFVKLHCGKGSNNKKVPEFIFRAEDKIKRAFIWAYLSGDGWITSNTTTIRTTSERLISQLRQLFSIYGIWFAISKVKFKNEKWHISYSGRLGGHNYRLFAQSVGFDTHSIKVDITTTIMNEDYIFAKISSIEKTTVENERVYNMEVEDDHSYILNGFVNHNCTEIIRNRRGVPVNFFATDGATFRIADSYEQDDYTKGEKEISGYTPSYVQIYQNKVLAEFYPWELMFGVRNPQTDIRLNGYGKSELEDMIQTVTALLNADFYNANFFKVGSAPKGILRYSGNINPNTVEDFKRQWIAQVAGVQNMHKIPLINADKLDFINTQQSNKDMEWSRYQEFLIKITCAMYKIDPSEIGFPMSGSAESHPMFEGNNEARLQYSKDKGLKPLLKRLQFWINKYLISQIDPQYEFRFVGIEGEVDAQTELDNDIKGLQNFNTLNEIRAKRNLPLLPNGDVPLNPMYIQLMMSSMEGGMEEGSQGEDQQEETQKAEEDNPIMKALENDLEKILCE